MMKKFLLIFCIVGLYFPSGFAQELNIWLYNGELMFVHDTVSKMVPLFSAEINGETVFSSANGLISLHCHR